MAVALDTRVLGEGTPAVLVHGGAGPGHTWAMQEPLARHRRLVIPSRRGFDGTPSTGRQDFEHDAEDLEPLLEPRAHLVGFSYGGLGALIVAGRRPELVISLVIIETPLFAIARGDPDVDHFEQLSNEFMADGLEARPEVVQEFLPVAALPAPGSGPLPQALAADLELARGGRPPGEARPDLDAIGRARFPVLVVSGDHLPAIERVCDAIAARVDGERAVIAGRGHAIPRAEGFNARLETFWTAAEEASRSG